MYRLPTNSDWVLALLGMLVSGALAAAPARPMAPATAPDLNPDPDIVEVVLVAREDYVKFGVGKATKVWTYNGGIPGPTIRGKTADTLIVHFYNQLPEATTIHWHGMDVPANMDGSHVAQLPVEPNGSGERADVVFTPHGKGPLPLEWHDVARGRHSTFYNADGSIGIGHAHDDGKRPPQVLMCFKLIANDRRGDYLPPDPLRAIESIDTTGARKLVSMFGHGAPDASGDVTFFVQMKPDGSGGMLPLPFDTVTPADAYTVAVGENGIWEVHNMTGGMHNFHTHGFSFQLLETQFVDMDTPENNYTVPAPFLEIKDTIQLPARPEARGRSRTILRLAASFDDPGREGMVEAFGKVSSADNSGGWLFHCHLLEHSARGMMSFLQAVSSD